MMKTESKALFIDYKPRNYQNRILNGFNVVRYTVYHYHAIEILNIRLQFAKDIETN